VVGEPGVISGLGTETLRVRNVFESDPTLCSPSGAEGIFPIVRGNGGRCSSSSWVRVLARWICSAIEPTDGLRFEGCKLDRDVVLECSGVGSSSGRGGGGRLAEGVVDRGSRPEASESARVRFVSIFNSVGGCLESLRARTPGIGGGPIVGGGGGLVNEARCGGRPGKSDDTGTGGNAAVGGEEGKLLSGPPGPSKGKMSSSSVRVDSVAPVPVMFEPAELSQVLPDMLLESDSRGNADLD
jgi:hypothetical protein